MAWHGRFCDAPTQPDPSGGEPLASGSPRPRYVSTSPRAPTRDAPNGINELVTASLAVRKNLRPPGANHESALQSQWVFGHFIGRSLFKNGGVRSRLGGLSGHQDGDRSDREGA